MGLRIGEMTWLVGKSAFTLTTVVLLGIVNVVEWTDRIRPSPLEVMFMVAGIFLVTAFRVMYQAFEERDVAEEKSEGAMRISDRDAPVALYGDIPIAIIDSRTFWNVRLMGPLVLGPAGDVCVKGLSPKVGSVTVSPVMVARVALVCDWTSGAFPRGLSASLDGTQGGMVLAVIVVDDGDKVANPCQG